MKRKKNYDAIDYAKAFIDELAVLHYAAPWEFKWLGYFNNYEIFMIARDKDINLYATDEDLKIKDVKNGDWYSLDVKKDSVENFKAIRSLAFDIAKLRFEDNSKKYKYKFYEDKDGQLCMLCNTINECRA